METDRKRIEVTIDGTKISVPEGTAIIDACERIGVVIPRYCYHPALSAPAVCRMCLVEVEGAPKPLPSCAQQVQDGMVVRTDTPAARKARRAAVEFLLVNHPLDCPICDAAGQCELQDYAWETGQLQTRNVEAKVVLGRDKITPEIVYFGDRCVLCTRCVRFMTEIAQEPVLQVIQRGHRGYIDTMTDELFEHPFSMNIVDVCPVGALVNEDFLFKARAWDLDRTASVCPGCSQGCNITLGTKENRVLRAKPRPNPEVNSFWMCDHGRKLVINWGVGERIEAPLLRDEGRLVAVDWGRALGALIDLLGRKPGEARAIVSPGSSNENLYVLRRLMDLFGFDGGGFRTTSGEERMLKGFPKLALRNERAANVKGAEALGFRPQEDVYRAVKEHEGVILVLDEVLDDPPEKLGERAAALIYVGTVMNAVARRADIVLPSTEFTEMEGTFTNRDGRVQRFMQAVRAPGLARPFWMTGSVALARVGAGEAYRSAGAAFAALAVDFNEFSGLSYDSIGLNGAVAAGSSASAVS